MYWSSSSLIRLPLIAESMNLKRFEKLKRYIHFIDNDALPENNKDIFIKIRPVIQSLNDSFGQVSSPTENVAIDEMIIPFKGRSRAKQYIKSKPKKWGFKARVVASADGYVSKFEMYQGSTKNDNSNSPMGPIADTVIRLCKGLEGVNHKLYLDNLFNSIPLCKELLKKEIYVVGTLRKNRMMGADEMLKSEKDLGKEGRGTMSVVTSTDNITITRWMDNRPVHMLSTFAGKEPMDKVQRYSRILNKMVEVSRPFSVSTYNKFMGGVDMSDRMVAHYPHALKNKKFYLRIFFHLLNVALVNAWVVFRNTENNKMSFVDFKLSICHAVFESRVKKRKGRPSQQEEIEVKKRARPGCSDEVRLDVTGHFPDKRDLANALRCRYKQCKKRTRYFCLKCDVPLCPECMSGFHS